MTKKICGWYRIGVVLSIIWVFLVSGIAIYECFRNRASGHLIDDIGISSVFGMTISQAFVGVAIDLFRHELFISSRTPTFKNQRISSQLDSTDKRIDQPEIAKGKDKFGKPDYKIIFKIKNFLCVLFLPILGMWGLVLGIVRAVLWIKEGFKNKNEN